ncbi:S phase cyclin A-associated protein in the endoplasmic reticulum-like [Lytechinus variegatus]|uniref:S phase cyclin A-associated protein in the endoplasmic reticulum-like n=1 Tax=Lytechinus variegatus TaxID=7654 RepID=UPI001BB2A4CD|nr:S phase cyclin A-associated protein in the endoplasmic reticulum-like [Lytechinus variegatus]
MNDSRRRRSSGNSRQNHRSVSSVNGGHDASNTKTNGSLTGRDSGVRSKNFKSSYQRSGSYDKVRRLVKEEGRMARNLVTWNVPVDSDDSDARKKSQSMPSLDSPRDQKSSTLSQKEAMKIERQTTSGSLTPGRKKAIAKKVDLRARYWAFLFDNLQRAVDEIYQTCEVDESIVECKEVIMILKSATQDFESLIKRITVQKDFENADAENRPTSLAWEVRKTSPGHTLGSPTPDGYRSTPSPVNRSLNFGTTGAQGSGKASPVPVAPMGTSWADRVKGKKPIRPVPQSPIKEEPAKQTPPPPAVPSADAQNDTRVPSVDGTHSEDADDEGWETVQRSKQNRSRPSSAKHSSTSSNNNSRHHPTGNNSMQSSTNRAPAPPSSYSVQTSTTTVSNKPPLPAESKPRERADSEKENRPDHVEQRNTASGGGSVNRQLMQETQNVAPAVRSLDIKEEDPCIISASTRKAIDSSSDEEQGDDDNEEVLATKLDDVENGSTDLDEEDTLTNELAKCQEEALARAIAEEESLNKEIQEEEQTEIVVETDDAESDLGNTLSSLECSQQAVDWAEMALDFEKRESEGASWNELVNIAENVESARTPGYALHMHEKLSSPSRKRTREESQKRHEERQSRAQSKREQLAEAKSNRLTLLHEKVEEVVEWKDELIKQKKKLLEEKQKRAEEKRLMQLQAVIRKAQDEEAKANEIAFINSLEAQNKKHDIMARHQGHEARYHDILEERQRKNEEKAAKEEAVQERRKALEDERIARLEAMKKYRREQEEKMNALKEQRELARENALKEKAKEREQRLSALTAAQSAKEEEIQKKIQQKHDESQKRHSQQIEQKRERAIELSTLRHYRTSDSAPKQKPYEKKKMCNLCNVLIPSEVYLMSHLRGKKHREKVAEKHKAASISEEELENYSVKLVVEAPGDQSHPEIVAERERQKASRKRARKLRQRMASKGKEYENNLPSKTQGQDSHHKAKLQKLLKDLNKYLQAQDSSGPWEQSKVSAMERALGEVNRILDKKEQTDQIMFRAHGGLSVLTRVLMLIDSASSDKPAVVPKKTLCSSAEVFRLACRNNFDNCQYTMYSGKMAPLIDLLMHQLSILIPDTEDGLHGHPWGPDSLKPPHDSVAGSLMLLLTSILNVLVKHRPQSPSSPDGKLPSSAKKKQKDTFDQWGMDVVSYLVSCGVLDKLTVYFNNVRNPIDQEPQIAEFLQHAMGLLGAMTRFISTTSNRLGIFGPKKDDPTQLVATFQVTGLGGIVSLLYGILLHGGAPSRDSSMTPPEIPEHTLSVVNAGIKMLSSIATLDLNVLQTALGAEGTSLEFRHIATYLMWYCSHFTANEDLLHEVILIVGYITVLNLDNQILVQTGNTPTLLQQLCSLPFQYFSDPRLINVLFPTLISCCYDNAENKKILQQEMSCSLLMLFLEERQRDKSKGALPSVTKARAVHDASEKDPSSHDLGRVLY